MKISLHLSKQNLVIFIELFQLKRWLDPAYFGENLYFYIFAFLLFIWSHGDHGS